MDANDPEVRRTLEDSLKDLAWMRTETKQRQADLTNIEAKLEAGRTSGKLDELTYQMKRIELETSRAAITDTLRMIQRQRTLVTSWIIEAQKKRK